MSFFTKKRVVLFLLFIFPLICFLILSTGENNFKKLPVVRENIQNLSKINLENKVSVVCFLGSDANTLSTGILNLNEKIYKKFIDYNDFQIVALYPKEAETEALRLKDDLSKYTNMVKWKFLPLEDSEIKNFYLSFKLKDSLQNLGSTKAFLIDKDVNLRGRTDDKDFTDGLLLGYNLNSVAELNSKLKDDIKVLFYEYYAAFKDRNKNKADRKEVGL